ncbi:MAG: hypothetical protein EHM13_05205 [Acidobacteria bacterium]|nr:MAG: hypothetical protein EHM13_05205 [Acidobacteriota bacterium]
MSGNVSASFSRVRFIQLGEPIDVAVEAPPPASQVGAENGAQNGHAASGRPCQPAVRPRPNGRQLALQVQREQEAYRSALIRIRERGMPMKLTRVELAPDGTRLLFYFTSEGRVDFRDLVRELATEFRIRIEMRQIGVRDEARLLGGYGSCGRPLCCASWLHGFEPVSIKMAKQQDLSLNPWKLSGLCGRLKCCLRFELEGKCCQKRAGNGADAIPDESVPEE